MPNSAPLQPDDPSLSLALALVCTSPTPLLLLNGGSTITAVSASFCQAFGIDAAKATGRPIFDLGAGEWDVPQLRTLIEATASGEAAIESYEFDLRPPNRPVRNLIFNVHKLPLNDPLHSRVVVAIADVTETRAAASRDRVLAENNAVLLKEAQHRIANSLQIIASVMMLNARRTSSEETRGHLRDAHSRVMSIAELQQQLAASGTGAVAIGPYLRRLCQTISASMIANPEALAIKVASPDVTVDADVSVSLGLIVTELVINSLKHGFPDEAGGQIDVSYKCEGPTWTLSICDNGVGMPKVRSKAIAGLGTSIVQALASQLGAIVEVTKGGPGTRVEVVHAAITPMNHPDPIIKAAA
jgi:PAS domain S-box-containing protein